MKGVDHPPNGAAKRHWLPTRGAAAVALKSSKAGVPWENKDEEAGTKTREESGCFRKGAYIVVRVPQGVTGAVGEGRRPKDFAPLRERRCAA